MNTWTGKPEDLASAYARHCATLRGALRQALVTRAVLTHLPRRPCSVVDIGAGTGEQGVALARAGHTVTLLDPDPAMIDLARERVDAQTEEVRKRITVVVAPGEKVADEAGGDFDAVLCHGVLMYVDDPDALLRALVDAARPGAIVSVLAKNRGALAMRPGMEGRWSDALTLLNTDTDTETGNLGVTSRGLDRLHCARVLGDAGAPEEAWYGVRVFTDHLADTPVGADYDTVTELEWVAGTRDPYRDVARLWHLIARRAIA